MFEITDVVSKTSVQKSFRKNEPYLSWSIWNLQNYLLYAQCNTHCLVAYKTCLLFPGTKGINLCVIPQPKQTQTCVRQNSYPQQLFPLIAQWIRPLTCNSDILGLRPALAILLRRLIRKMNRNRKSITHGCPFSLSISARGDSNSVC